MKDPTGWRRETDLAVKSSHRHQEPLSVVRRVNEGVLSFSGSNKSGQVKLQVPPARTVVRSTILRRLPQPCKVLCTSL